MSNLIERLSVGKHPINVERMKNSNGLKQALDRGFVLLRFTGTKGETEVGARIDRTRLNVSDADFDNSRGNVHLVGTMVLNYNFVEVIADIDVSTLMGTASMKVLADEAAWRKQKAVEGDSGSTSIN